MVVIPPKALLGMGHRVPPTGLHAEPQKPGSGAGV